MDNLPLTDESTITRGDCIINGGLCLVSKIQSSALKYAWSSSLRIFHVFILIKEKEMTVFSIPTIFFVFSPFDSCSNLIDPRFFFSL